MNRNDEYRALLAELHDAPKELAGTAERALARERRARRGKWLGIPLASVGGLASAFVLLVNCSLPFALACGRVPGLRELAAAVALSPSLKAAVENGFVQAVGQEQTENGVTLRLEYLILDSAQINFFYTVSGADYERYHIYPSISGPDGEELEGYSIISGEAVPGELSDLNVNYAGGDEQVPEAIRLTCEVTAMPGHRTEQAAAPADQSIWDEPGDRWRPQAVATFTFDLELDPELIVPSQVHRLDRWAEVDGQRLLFRELEIDPTHARLAVSTDPENTAWLRGLEFYLMDEDGARYGSGSRAGSAGRLVSSGEDGTDGTIYYYLESSFFQAPEHLTLYITGAEWLDKGREWAAIDLETGDAEGLPEGVEVGSIQRAGEDVRCTLTSEEVSQLITWNYRDPEGGEHRLESMGVSAYDSEERGGEEVRETMFTLQDYPWDEVELELRISRTSRLEAPLEVPLT